MYTLFPAGLWQQIKSELRNFLDQKQYDAWISCLEAKESSDNEIIIVVPNQVFYHGIISECFDAIETCKAKLGIETSIRFEVEGSPEIGSFEDLHFQDTGQSIEPRGSEGHKVSAPKDAGILPTNSVRPNVNLNNSYTFANFVGGPSNQFAMASCLNVAKNPGQAYNPLFIYGSTGLGKTHLLHAVGNYVSTHNQGANVTYISSERFMNEMIYCLRFNKMWDFRQKYRHCDVFLVDDIQFISGKKKTTQEEFFHTFNSLYEAKKQIVITSDLFPQDIPDIEDRLRNRFQWGLIADIQPPDVEHRVAILNKKALELNITLPNDVATYIASHAKRNVRELEGNLHRIAAFAALQGRAIDMSLTIETFQNVLGEVSRNLNIDTVQKTVADHFNVRVLDLKSKKRQRALTLPRQIAMFLSRKLTNASFPEIGDQFGGKDHSTVMHAVKKIEKDKTLDLDLKAHIETLERQLEQMH